MGCFYALSSSSNSEPHPTDPDPHIYHIKKMEVFGRITVLLVNYLNCTNYEGMKILVIKDYALSKKHVPGHGPHLQRLDPHFLEGGSLLARFAPTDDGWSSACLMASLISVDDKLHDAAKSFSSYKLTMDELDELDREHAEEGGKINVFSPDHDPFETDAAEHLHFDKKNDR